VTKMMRSVSNEGTGAGARTARFTLDAAGKTGTTNDLRDAWFAGFTPELLTVVWVGFDDNQPVGLSGAQAALPIWVEFMKRALAGHSSVSFRVPEGIVFADIDHDSGLLATPDCPRVITEAFLEGTVPTKFCEPHKDRRRSGSAQRCWSTPTAASSAPSAGAATKMTRSGRRATRLPVAGRSLCTTSSPMTLRRRQGSSAAARWMSTSSRSSRRPS